MHLMQGDETTMTPKKTTSKDRIFVIEVKDTQNDTWQGVITWTKEGKTVPFRSTLEMIRLLDSAVGSSDTPTW